MDKGFAILVWDAWSAGLVRVGARLLDDGTKDMYGNPNNWFPYSTIEEAHELIDELTEGLPKHRYKIIFD